METEIKKKKPIGLIFILFVFVMSFIANLQGAFTQGSKADSIVPLMGLDFQTHIIVFLILWPTLVSILCVIIFPLLLVPIILVLKNIIWHKYTNCYIDLGKVRFDGKKFIRRFIYVFLLVLGICATLLSYRFFDPLLLVPGEMYTEHPAQSQTENFLYYPEVFMGFSSLILPLVVGLWSVGWTMEDAGLMHFKLPKEEKKVLYEIEPVHLKYNGLIKGYAGITAILYLVSAINFYATYDLIPLMNQVIFGVVISTFLFVPGYVIYLKLAGTLYTKMFRKGKKQAQQMTEKNFPLE